MGHRRPMVAKGLTEIQYGNRAFRQGLPFRGNGDDQNSPFKQL